MKPTRILFALGLLLGAASPALAAATPDEAQRLTALFQSYIGSQPGVVSVTPQGDSYAAKLDLSPLFARLKEPGISLAVSPLEWTLTDQGGGKWKLDQNQPLTFAFGVAGEADTKGAIASVTSTGLYDEALGAFTTSSAKLSGITAEQTVTDKGQTTKVNYTLDSIAVEGTMQGTPDSADGTSTYTYTNLKETISSPAAADGSMPAMDITIASPSGTQSGDIKGLRLQAVKDLVTWFVAHPDQPSMVADQAALKDKLRAALPLFTTLSGTTALDDLSVGTAFGQFSMKKLGFSADMNGISADGRLRETFSFEGLDVPAGLIPPWAAGLVPQNFSIDVAVSDFNLAAPAALILDKLDLAKPDPMPSDMDQQLLQALMPKNAVTITLAPSAVLARLFQLNAEGSMSAGPIAMPSGQATVKLKGLDETMAALQAGPPDFQQIAPMVLLLKGLAKTESDGALSWKIEANEAGTVTVNGNDMTKMLGAGQQ